MSETDHECKRAGGDAGDVLEALGPGARDELRPAAQADGEQAGPCGRGVRHGEQDQGKGAEDERRVGERVVGIEGSRTGGVHSCTVIRCDPPDKISW